MNLSKVIDTYIINLKSRCERKKNVLQEFNNKEEFNVKVVEAIENKTGSIGLWETIKHILADLADDSQEYVLICEDDHQFTENYSKTLLFESIRNAIELKADVLSGGVSWFTNALGIRPNLFWVEIFSGTQFIVIFKKFFKQILAANFEAHDSADYKMCSLSQNIFFIYPFISIQYDYGYSDATPKNNIEGRVKALFDNSIEGVKVLEIASVWYTQKLKQPKKETQVIPDAETMNKIAIPTYIIHFFDKPEREIPIGNEFKDKNEFLITNISVRKNENNTYDLWNTLQHIIRIAIENDDDVIAICRDDHEFTNEYTKEYLLKNIIEAHDQGAGYLSGSCLEFRHLVPIAKNRYWTSLIREPTFFILYKKIFHTILEEPADSALNFDIQLSRITSHKMILYPFISQIRDFGDLKLKRIVDEHKMKTEQLISKINFYSKS